MVAPAGAVASWLTAIAQRRMVGTHVRCSLHHFVLTHQAYCRCTALLSGACAAMASSASTGCFVVLTTATDSCAILSDAGTIRRDGCCGNVDGEPRPHGGAVERRSCARVAYGPNAYRDVHLTYGCGVRKKVVGHRPRPAPHPRHGGCWRVPHVPVPMAERV